MTCRYPRKAEIARAIEAAREGGLKVTGIEVSSAGIIKVLGPGHPTTTQNDFDKWDSEGRL